MEQTFSHRMTSLIAENTAQLVKIERELKGVVMLPRAGCKIGVTSNLTAGGWSLVNAETGKQLVFVNLAYSLKDALHIADMVNLVNTEDPEAAQAAAQLVRLQELQGGEE